MALNWAMLNANRTPVPLLHETIIKSIESGADIILTIPEMPPSGSATSGGLGGEKRLVGSGGLWLTDQRVIFVSSASDSPAIDSLTVPLTSLLSTKFHQPLFGGNYLEIEIIPSPEGRLANGTKAEIRLKDRGLFEFASALDKTRERAIEARKHRFGEEGEGLPEYSTASPSSADPGPSAAGTSAHPDAPPAYEM